MTTEIDREVPSNEVGKLNLLSSPVRLPPSASNVRLHFLQFQDPVLHVRFHAPLVEAEQFVARYVGQPIAPGCGDVELRVDGIDWWLHNCPPTARYAKQIFSDNPPARTAVIVPDGAAATVFIYSFET